MTPAGWRHVAPPEHQYKSNYSTNSTTDRNNRRWGDKFRGGPSRHKSRPLANDHPHTGNAEGLGPPFVGNPDDESGVGGENPQGA